MIAVLAHERIPCTLSNQYGNGARINDALKRRRHVVVVVAESAGQNLFDETADEMSATDASGNVRLKDVGTLSRDRISDYLKLMNVPFTLKYIDPSYLIPSAPSMASDSLFAGILGQMAVHAAMAGKTSMFVGYWNNQFTHVPIAAAVSNPKRLDPKGNLWQSVVQSTGQPRMVNHGESPDRAEELFLAESCVPA